MWKPIKKLVLGILLPGVLQAAPVAAQPLFSSEQLAVMKRADGVELAYIGWMRQTPRMIGPDDQEVRHNTRQLDREDALQMVNLLQQISASSTAPESAQCHFAPGYRISFWSSVKDGRRTRLETALICLNCDVLARGRPGVQFFAGSEGVDRYGNAQSQRTDLLTALRKYFPAQISEYLKSKH